jgi:leucyl-tRNA synthetase
MEWTQIKARFEIAKWLNEKSLSEPQINYKLRDWVFSRQHYWGEPIPMVYCQKCGWQPLPEKDLPLALPKVKKYKPTDTGESPLAAIKNWVNTKCPKCKGSAQRETDTMPNWAGSNWYFLRYIDPKNNKELAERK